MEQRKVLRVDGLEAVRKAVLEEIGALGGDAEALVAGGGAELGVGVGLGVHIVQHDQVSVQGAEPQVRLSLLRRPLRGQAVLYLGVHVADADADMPVVSGHPRRLHADIGGHAVDVHAVQVDAGPVRPDPLQQLFLVERLEEAPQVFLVDIAVGVPPAFSEEVRPPLFRRPLAFLGP